MVEVVFEYDGGEYPMTIHTYGSHAYLHAARFLLANSGAKGARQMKVYAEYAAMLVEGWDESCDEFFGGSFSDDFVKKIFVNPANIWLVNAVVDKAKEVEKK